MSEKNDYILTPDGELYHWKYVRREKVNGKWRYWYADEEEEEGYTAPSERPIGQNYRTSEDVAREKAAKTMQEETKRNSEAERLSKSAGYKSALNKVERAVRIGEQWIAQNLNQSVIGFQYKSLDEARAWVDDSFPFLRN